MSPHVQHSHLVATLIGILIAASFSPAAQPAAPVLIPLPAKFVVREGSFVLGPKTAIRSAKREAETAKLLAESVAHCTGINAHVLTESPLVPHDGDIFSPRTLPALDLAKRGTG